MRTSSSVKTLKQLSRQFPPTLEMHNMIIGLTARGDHRALAITCASLLERALEEYVSSALKWPDDEAEAAREKRDFFQNDAPFATFSAKIKLGFMLGLYNKVVRDDLDTVREIRNAFAHSTSHIDFKTTEALGDQSLASMARFGLVSQALTGLFLQAANESWLRDKMPEFGASWRLEAPPAQNAPSG